MTVTLLTLGLFLPAAPAPTPKLERPEAGKLPPRIVWITLARDDGKFQIVDTELTLVQAQREVTMQQGGQEKKITMTFTESRPVTVVRSLDVNTVRFYGLDGKKIDSKEAQKLLTKDQPALLSADGKPVDRAYLHLARQGTLVLVVPPSAALPIGEARPAPEQKLPARLKE